MNIHYKEEGLSVLFVLFCSFCLFSSVFVCLFSFVFVCLFVCLMVFNVIFNNISVITWRPVLLVEETGVPGKNDGPAARH